MTGGFSPEQDAMVATTKVSDGQIPTDVDGISANGIMNNLYVFDVDRDDFFNNMKEDRKRQRFKSDTNVAKYARATKYNNPFYVRYKDEDGKAYIRKIK